MTKEQMVAEIALRTRAARRSWNYALNTNLSNTTKNHMHGAFQELRELCEALDINWQEGSEGLA